MSRPDVTVEKAVRAVPVTTTREDSVYVITMTPYMATALKGFLFVHAPPNSDVEQVYVALGNAGVR